MNAPRVLQVVLSLNPGGTERLVVEIVRRLHNDIPMMVCCIDEDGAWAQEVRAEAIDVVAVQRAPGFRPSVGGAIARAARRHRATVVHAHQYSPFVYSCFARLWGSGLPMVFTEHGRLSDAPPSAKRRAANSVLGRFAHRVFAVSHDLKRHLVAEGFGADAVEVIYNGIRVGPQPDAPFRARVRERLGVADDEIVVGTIGRLDPVKDMETLITAVDGLPVTARVLLIIVGDGPERDHLQQVASGSPSTRVRFLGHRDDARDWLAGCDIYVNSSISEGVSLTILEAMAAGLPIVATKVGGTPEVVDESCARLVPPRDRAALSSAIHQLAQDPDTRHHLGRLARQRVEQRFTVERMVDDYRVVYQSANRYAN